MNRRQFLTGASAIAVLAAMPAAPASPIVGIDLASGPDTTAHWIHFAGRYYWFNGKDCMINFSEPCDISKLVERRIADAVFAERNDVYKL